MTRYIAFDVETTGLVPGVDRIIELAAVMFEGPVVLESFERLVDPGLSIPKTAALVNGITDSMVHGAPSIEETLPGFLRFLGQGTPVAHNATFDVGFITADARRSGKVPPAGPVLDTRGLAQRAFPKRTSYSLQNLAKDFGLVSGTHRALADAHVCRQLFLRCREMLGDDVTAAALAQASGAPLDFICHAPRHTELAKRFAQVMRCGRDVRIHYRSSGGDVTERDIQPLAFAIIGGAICIRAFCRLRGEERIFRLDAITLL